MLSLSGTLLVGLLVGVLARVLKPGTDTLGWVMMGLLGITGAFLATYVGLATGWFDPGEASGWIASATGAMLLAGLFSLITNNG
ncbi:GlsB/YeaQ/YmgE family stress response membrane protein [Acidovorax sp.]|uniref:GlsB/YeaQ/YmgE family stress response membrane protein n=1 Tax=Acidovorax sp. TaxID=1872122 RepID=UPI0025C1AD0E|nr:GlsB/YeaQ/YmgE family stress response membrane protein [Acidovorax sp.]